MKNLTTFYAYFSFLLLLAINTAVLCYERPDHLNFGNAVIVGIFTQLLYAVSIHKYIVYDVDETSNEGNGPILMEICFAMVIVHIVVYVVTFDKTAIWMVISQSAEIGWYFLQIPLLVWFNRRCRQVDNELAEHLKVCPTKTPMINGLGDTQYNSKHEPIMFCRCASQPAPVSTV